MGEEARVQDDGEGLASYVARVVEDLASEDLNVRRRARTELVDIGAAAIPALIRHLRAVHGAMLATNPDTGTPANEVTRLRQVVDAIEDVLAGIGKEAIGPMLDLIDDDLVGRNAVSVLCHIGPDSTEQLMNACVSGSAKARAGAVFALGHISTSQRMGQPVRDLLLRLSCDQDADLRAEAANALASGGSVPGLVDHYRAWLDDSDDRVRYSGIRMLGALRLVEDVPRLAAVLREHDYLNTLEALRVLGTYGPRAVQAVPMIQGLLAKRPSGEVRFHAQEALDSIRGVRN